MEPQDQGQKAPKFRSPRSAARERAPTGPGSARSARGHRGPGPGNASLAFAAVGRPSAHGVAGRASPGSGAGILDPEGKEAKAVGRTWVLQNHEASASRSLDQEVTLAGRPAKARGATKRSAPKAPRPFPRAAGRGREAGMDAGAGGRVGRGSGTFSGEPRRAAKGSQDPRTAWAGFLSPGRRGLLPRECAPSWDLGQVPAFGSHPAAPCLPRHPGAGPQGPLLGGPVGRTERATRRLAGRRAAGWGPHAPGRC